MRAGGGWMADFMLGLCCRMFRPVFCLAFSCFMILWDAFLVENSDFFKNLPHK
jgi:hypothetical protein